MYSKKCSLRQKAFIGIREKKRRDIYGHHQNSFFNGGWVTAVSNQWLEKIKADCNKCH